MVKNGGGSIMLREQESWQKHSSKSNLLWGNSQGKKPNVLLIQSLCLNPMRMFDKTFILPFTDALHLKWLGLFYFIIAHRQYCQSVDVHSQTYLKRLSTVFAVKSDSAKHWFWETEDKCKAHFWSLILKNKWEPCINFTLHLCAILYNLFKKS